MEEETKMGGGLKKKLPTYKRPPKKVEMVEVTRMVKRVGKPPHKVVVKVPKDHPLAKGS